MFRDLDTIINCALNTNQRNINDSLISKIHDEINIYYNSVNIAVGKQGSGKTLSDLKEIIKISKRQLVTVLEKLENFWKSRKVANLNLIP